MRHVALCVPERASSNYLKQVTAQAPESASQILKLPPFSLYHILNDFR